MNRKEYLKNYQREWMKKRRMEFFSGKWCAKCSSIENLELDHIDPSTKEHHAIWSWSELRRNRELIKCQVLCKTCHREKSNGEMLRPITHGLTGYHRGCRCGVCKKAHSVEMKDYHEKTR